MNTAADRARAYFSEKAGAPTAKTDETPFSSVLAVPMARVYENATVDELVTVAMRACDAHSDGPAAREQMRLDCLATPQHLRADLIGHFTRAYPRSPVDEVVETMFPPAEAA